MTEQPVLIEHREFADIDRHFAHFIKGFGEGDLAPFAAAMLSRNMRHGHICLDLNGAPANFGDPPLALAWPELCNGALTVVGDDDQSLYRFRGATVELFRDFETRYMSFFKRQPRKIFLNENYRSSATIVQFVNAYVNLDAGYQTVRVNGKPALTNPTRRAYETPILGMFRDGMERLASDLATFIYQVTKGKGYRLASGEVIKVDSARNGDVGDCALLCSSPQEFNMADEPRLPLRLKDELRKQPTQILVFNPRGQDFASIPEVQRLGGLLLCCLDRYGGAEDVVAKGLDGAIRSQFQAWTTLVEEDMKRGRLAKTLCDFVDGWSKRTPVRQGYRWPKSSATIDLLYEFRAQGVFFDFERAF